MNVIFIRKMNVIDVLFSILAFLHTNQGTSGLNIFLTGFKPDCAKCRNAFQFYNVTGILIAEEGDQIPEYINYEYKCPSGDYCTTHNGAGLEFWEWQEGFTVRQCDRTQNNYRCEKLTEGIYKLYYSNFMYYVYRFCQIRARLVDVRVPAKKVIRVNATGIRHVSNVLTLSDFAKDPTIYDTFWDELFEDMDRTCRFTYPPWIHAAAKNGQHKLRYNRDVSLVYFGTLLVINMWAFN